MKKINLIANSKEHGKFKRNDKKSILKKVQDSKNFNELKEAVYDFIKGGF